MVCLLRLNRHRQRVFSSCARLAKSYKDSITDLNSLQSNAATISALRASGNMNKDAIPEMRSWLTKAGVEQSDIDELKFIHVAGTKGKGSTSAMVASILSNYRLAYGKAPKVGLYTSPHLKSVRERIQIDGTPLPEDEWTEYFYDVWSNLEKSGNDKPVYFRFLTILAFHTFVQECVDVVVMECGVGGEHDSTNVITQPVASGITSLGVDHVHVLGKTIEEIAWHKAGIFKPDCPAFTVQQPEAAMDVLISRAKERSVSSLQTVPVHPALDHITLGLNGDFQKSNASLAIALANAYLKTQGVDENLSSKLPEEFVAGLEHVHWPGRCEQRRQGGIAWCLDGGHTAESLTLAGSWYANLPRGDQSTTSTQDFLIFNQQTRDSSALLADLYHSLRTGLRGDIHFDTVIFCTNKTFAKSGYSAELTSINHAGDAVEAMDVQHALAKKWHTLTQQRAHVVSSIEEAVRLVQARATRSPSSSSTTPPTIRCLVTGSLHLVGGMMTVLDGDSSVGGEVR